MSMDRDDLRRLENPYAKLSMGEEMDDRQAFIRLLQDPYAVIETSDDSLFGSIAAEHQNLAISNETELLPANNGVQSISQRDFATRCRSIFMQYTPLTDGHQHLQPDYQDFIVRGKKKDGRVRIAILEDLERFDLSDLGGIKPHLNRERVAALRAKLTAILNKHDA
jgi:hypothetical protein